MRHEVNKANANSHYPYWIINQTLTEGGARAKLSPICHIERSSDYEFFYSTGFIDLLCDSGVSNVQISGATCSTRGSKIPIFFLTIVRSGKTVGHINHVNCEFGPGDCYAIAPGWTWSLTYTECEHQSLVIPVNDKFFEHYDDATINKIIKLTKLLPWDTLVEISKSEAGKQFILASLFGQNTFKPSFAAKALIKFLQNAQHEDLLLKQIAADLGCSLAALSQVKFAGNIKFSSWQREIRNAVIQKIA
jgi:hypothetical protein